MRWALALRRLLQMRPTGRAALILSLHTLRRRSQRTLLFRNVLPLMLLLSARGIAQPSLPVTRLSVSETEFPVGYRDLRALRELPGNTAIILDRCEPLLKLIDFSTGKATAIGRNGSGPTEYRSADHLLPLPGDSSIMLDSRSRRFLIIDPTGNPVRFIPSPPLEMVRSFRGYIGSNFRPTSHDGLGRLYSRGSPFGVSAQGFARADSAAIERWDYRSGRRDTVAFIETLRGGELVIPLEPPKPFAPAVAWAVSSEGRVAKVHPEGYWVEFTDPSGKAFRGEPNGFDRVRLSEAHKDQWRKMFESACRSSRPPASVQISSEWPGDIPPFLVDAAVFDPSGILWVRRELDPTAPPAYDLIDKAGRVFHRVVLASPGRLIGFGAGVVYTVRIGINDLQYIQRHKFVPPSKP